MKARGRGLVASIALAAVAPALAAGLAGDYVGVDAPGLRLQLVESGDGRISGTLSEEGEDVVIEARRQGAGFTGAASRQGEKLPVTGRLAEGRLLLELGPPGEATAILMAPRAAQAPRDKQVAASPPAAAVTINGRVLDAADLRRAETAYRLRIPAGRYWYDRVLGAWGAEGGPTMGFLGAGLDLGGPLPAHASGGGTGVFVNGRELHPYDLMALQQITGPIIPGRYFITADGLAGPEGGSPQWNLAQMAAQSAGANSPNAWQSRITGASGFSDGTTGAVFLPNGGIVSVGN